MTEPRQKIPVPGHQDYNNPQNILEDIHVLFRDMQPKRARIFKVAPVAYQLEEGEIVFLDTEAGGAGSLRLYTKLNGSLRFVNLT